MADQLALLREAARLMREEEAGSPTMVAVADLLQVLSWMPSIAHPADLDAAQRVARAYLGISDGDS